MRNIIIFAWVLLLIISLDAGAISSLSGYFKADSTYSKVYGKITDEKGNPMPYVYVLIANTSTGTSSNTKGEYSLKLKQGSHTLTFQHIGYKKIQKTISLQNDFEVNVTMIPEDVLLKTVTITNKYKDPAYAIIKSAQGKRKEHLEQVKSYSAEVYIKGIGRLDEIPKQRPFFLSKENMPDSTDLGLIYLSESRSKLFVKKPDDVKEEMISSKVAGSSQGYSFNRIGDVETRVNFYNNLIILEGLSQRGFVSPISQNAFLFYDYKLEGEIKEGERTINKIKVIPRRNNDPVFRGYIYIVDDTWNITGIDLQLADNQIDFFDDLKLKQDYIAINDSLWMPISVNIYAHLKALGFGASFSNVVSYSNYEVNREFPRFFFKGEVFKIEKEANKRDSSYWQASRPVLLTPEELKYYNKGDSTEKVHESKEYLDSMDRKNNKIHWTKLLLGYTYYRRYNETSYGLNSITDILNFNTVEGVNTNLVFTVRKGKYSERHFIWATTLRYGFSNGHFNPKTQLNWTMNRFKQQNMGIEGGKYVSQINNLNPVDPLTNSFYSLLDRENYMKLYEKTYAQVNYNQELVNGIYFKGEAAYEARHALTNTNNYAFIKETESRKYTSNDPLNTESVVAGFSDHQALIFNGELKFLIKQKFATMPYSKMTYGTKYPIFTIRYSKGLPAAGSDVNFDKASLTVNDNFDLGLFGRSTWNVTVGGFLNKEAVPFVDYKHFSGNQTIFLNAENPMGNFQLLNYYTFSTLSSYIEAHYEHHFNGFIINKIPILRRTKFQEVAGVNFLRTQNKQEHVELQFGIENIVKVLRIDFVTGYDNSAKLQGAIRLRAGLDLF